MARVLRSVRLRIFITSRPETPVRGGFQQIPEAERHVFVLHDISPKLVDRDLALSFEEHFNNIREERRLPASWPGERVISRLVECSGGLFIWASTACRYIRDGRHFASNRISKLINGHHLGAGPVKQLDQIYITVLRDSIRQDYDEEEKKELYERLRNVLGGLVSLFYPLSMDSLVNLLHIEAELVTETLADLHTIFNIPDQSDRPIRVHHPTFHDFILDRARCRDLDFWIDETEAHRNLAENCIRLMSQKLKQNICGLPSPDARVEDAENGWIERCLPPELRYACLNWAEHYRQSGTILRDNDNVNHFFREHFLHWLEAISLMRKGSEMVAIIRMYQCLLMPDDNPNQLPIVKDARRFMFEFQSIIEETPLQVYLTALAFFRPTSRLPYHFFSQMRPWLKDVRIADPVGFRVQEGISYVNDLAFTPDSRAVASGSVEPRVRVRDVATKATITKFEGQTDKVSSISISPDGMLLASGSDDTTVMVWDMELKAVRHLLTAHTRWVNAVVFSPDSKLLASGGMDETIRLWDVESGAALNILQTNSSCVNSLAFSPDGSLIASGTVDQMIRLWDIAKREIRIVLDGHLGPVNSVQFSANGKRVVSGPDDMTIRLWDVISGIELMIFKGHLKKVLAVSFSRDARLIVSGSEDKTIRLWNVTTGAQLTTMVGHTSGVSAVIYSPNGLWLASVSFNDEVLLWDTKTGESRGMLADFEDDAKFESSSTMQSAAIGSDGKQEDRSSDSNVVTYPSLTGHSSPVTCLVLSPDRQTVASASYDTTVKLWTKEGTERRRLDGHVSSINHLAFSPASHVVASASMDGSAKLWDSASGAMLHTLRGHSGSVHLLRFSSDGRVLASCSTDTTIRLWNTATGTVLGKLDGHSSSVNDVAFSPDNLRLVSCSADMTICIWDALSATKLQEPIKAHLASVNSIAFSPDGELFISCSSDRTLKIWDTGGAAHGTLVGHALPVHSAAFSRDAKQVVSCSDDGTVRIWDRETKSAQRILDVAIVVRDVSFSSCGQYIETDRGVLKIGTAQAGFSPPHSPLPSSQSVPATFVAENWLKRDEKDMLLLPDDRRATKVVVSGETTILGHFSGAISFIQF